MHVESIMSSNVACCTPDTTLQEVARMMMECDCGAIPVVAEMTDRQLVGIVTDRDITTRAVAEGRNPLTMSAGDVMSQPIVAVYRDASIADTLRAMEDNQIRRVPVIDEAHKLVGIVSQADVALKSPDQTTGQVVEEISRPSRRASDVSE